MKRVAQLLVSTMILTASVVFAQVTPPPQKGIRVQMPITAGASFLPDADKPDAWIVTVTSSGDLYFGIDSVTPEGLMQTMQSTPRNREQELYIKADARAQFSNVKQVLEAARSDFFRRVFLLTSTPAASTPGNIIPPAGIPLWVASASRPVAIVEAKYVDRLLILKLNGQEVALESLQRKLTEVLENQNEEKGFVLVKAEDVLFADVAHVVDACNMAGARPVALSGY